MVTFKTKKALRIFKALANETRLKILEIIYSEEVGMCKIRPQINKSQSLISNQLSQLQSLNLIASRKEGTKVHFRIIDEDLKKILKTIIKEENRTKEHNKKTITDS